MDRTNKPVNPMSDATRDSLQYARACLAEAREALMRAGLTTSSEVVQKVLTAQGGVATIVADRFGA